MRAFAALLLLAAAAFRPSAQALTAEPGSLQWRLQTGYSFANRVEGDRAAWRALSVGAAVELGLGEGLSLEVEWLPGYSLWSSLDYPDAAGFPNDDANRSGAHDLWAAARIQIARTRGLALVVAPGLVVPLRGPDWSRERARALDGKRYVFEAPDRHAIGIGARADFETPLGRAFGLGGSVRYVRFLEHEAASFDDPESEAIVDHGYELTGTLEPHGTADMGRTLYRAGLKATHVIRAEKRVAGRGRDG